MRAPSSLLCTHKKEEDGVGGSNEAWSSVFIAQVIYLVSFDICRFQTTGSTGTTDNSDNKANRKGVDLSSLQRGTLWPVLQQQP